jgi:xylan 1,4-beta-xylosidase
MLGMMGGRRVFAESSGAIPLEVIRQAGVRDKPEVSAMASRQERTLSILVWNYHDDDLPALPAEIELIVEGLPKGRVQLSHYRVDADHSNSYEAWKKMGSPQNPSAEQYARLERAGRLELLNSPERLQTSNGRIILRFKLPRQGVSLCRLTW